MSLSEDSDKLFYSIGEVAEMFDVNASLIRYWEKEFDIIRPQKNKKGNRLFTKKDIENFKTIYHLVKEKGFTLQGAKEALKNGSKPVESTSTETDTLRLSLLRMKAFLQEWEKSLPEKQ